MIQFKIRPYKGKKYVHVMVHDTLEEFYAEARKFHQDSGQRGERVKGTAGLFHGYRKIRLHKDGHTERLNDVGIIRLSKDRLWTGVVAHETLHAAMHLYRLRRRSGSADFGKDLDRREEEICHIYDELFRKMVRGLHRRKLWK